MICFRIFHSSPTFFFAFPISFYYYLKSPVLAAAPDRSLSLFLPYGDPNFPLFLLTALSFLKSFPYLLTLFYFFKHTIFIIRYLTFPVFSYFLCGTSYALCLRHSFTFSTFFRWSYIFPLSIFFLSVFLLVTCPRCSSRHSYPPSHMFLLSVISF